ncbi:MAG: SDR family NAD(P)-dependent oxidoreductase [Candidatus Nitrosoglobus sp.]
MNRKTALITGASGGIGKAIAEQFARDNTNLVITARNVNTLQSLSAQWSTKYGVKVMIFASDLALPGAAQALADNVLSQGVVIDYLVNNAGYGMYGIFRDLDLEDELAMMTINMASLTVLTKRFLPHIIERRGKIMNVASTAAFQPGPYMAVYYATKAYVLSLTEALASELEDTGVTVTALCPGPTQSGFQDKAAMNNSALVKGKKLPTADEVGQAGYRAMMAGKRVFVPGFMNKLLVQTVRFLPRSMVTAIVKKMSIPIS